MQALPKSLVNLSKAAACTEIADYPRELLRIVEQLLDFEGALAGQGRALLDHAGNIEIATACFRQMLLVEWPGWRAQDQIRLPDNLVPACLAAVKYEGSCVDFVMLRQGDYVVCTARRRSKLRELTPKENLVLLQFASGLSHKEIAQRTGSSQNTVRSHIAHGYSKLGIHNKATLANLFSPVYNNL